MIDAVERLNKVLAQAGVASRRAADTLIANGRITVNGTVVTDLGRQVDPARDDIELDGEPIAAPRAKHRYLALNKPRDVITTVTDPQGRPTVMDFVPRDVRLFPVGRLDGASEGLVIMTDDGDLANRLMHPRYAFEKEYRVKISGTPTDTALAAWREGMWLEEERTAPAEVRVESGTGAGTWLRFVIREGKNRQIRRMIEAFKFRVHRLVRVRIGPLTLGDLKPGKWRELTPAEVGALEGKPVEPSVPGKRLVPAAGGKSKYKPGWARAKPPKPRPGHRPRSGAPSRKGGPKPGRRGGSRPRAS